MGFASFALKGKSYKPKECKKTLNRYKGKNHGFGVYVKLFIICNLPGK
jgi:hypothetical protein